MDVRENGTVQSLKSFAAYASIVLVFVFGATLLYRIAAFVYFQVSGDLLGGVTARDMEWGEMGSLVLGSALIVGLLLAVAYFWLPDLEDGTATTTGESPRETPPESPPAAPSPTRSRVPSPGPARARSRASREEEALIRMVRAHPDPADAVRDFQSFLRSQERSSRNRDYQMLVLGTVLGVVAPVLSAPLLRNVPF